MSVLTGVSWAVTLDPSTDTARYTVSGAGVAAVDLSTVVAGDYVVIAVPAFQAVNRGCFQITNVVVYYSGATPIQYFEISSRTAVAEAGIAQTSTDDIVFFRPTRSTVNDAGPRSVVVGEAQEGLEIILPATTKAVSRGVGSGAYTKLRPALTPTSMIRNAAGLVTVGFAAQHNLVVGDHALIDGASPDWLPPAGTAGTLASTGLTGTLPASPLSFWGQTRNMDVAGRSYATVTKLNDGTVLIAAGNILGTGLTATCQLFSVVGTSTLADGSSQVQYNWLAAASMTGAREKAAAAVLTDSGQLGTVLVAGGNNGGALSTCQRFASSAWSSAGALGTARYNHTLTVLSSNNKVLAAGGNTGASTATAVCELYDPAANTWTATGSLNRARTLHQTVQLSDGRILATGGTDGTVARSSCEVFDGTTWALTGRMTYARYGHRAVVLTNNRVLVVGGTGYKISQPGSDLPILDAEVWDPTSGRWSPAGRLGVSHVNGEAVYLASRGVVLVAGGDASASTVKTEYFNVSTGIWSRGPRAFPAAQSRSFGGAVLLNNGAVLYASGTNLDGTTSAAAALVFVPGSDQLANGSLNGQVSVLTVPDITHFTYQSAVHSYSALSPASIPQVTPVKAIASGSIPGPYVYDDSPAWTAVQTTLTTALEKGLQYGQLQVADASSFPDSAGYIALGFGTKFQTVPIRVLGRSTATSLSIDYGFKMPVGMPIGTRVTLLAKKGAFVPNSPETAGSLYITASQAGRVAAQASLTDILGAGIDVNFEVHYPGDRGLGGEGLPATGAAKLSDKVGIWAGDDVDAEVAAARVG